MKENLKKILIGFVCVLVFVLILSVLFWIRTAMFLMELEKLYWNGIDHYKL